MRSTPFSPALLRGFVAELESTIRGLRVHRLPAWVRSQFPDGQLLAMEQQPSGVRVALRTSATRIELETHSTRIGFRGAERPRGRIDVWIDGELALSDPLTGGDLLETDLLTGESAMHGGPAHVTTLSGLPSRSKCVELWLPHNESIELVDLRTDAPVAPLEADGVPVWVHYGSSISQGSNAATPSRIWPAVAARRLGVSLHNLGLGGSAMVDPFIARTIRDATADLISLKLGINVVNLDAMRLRTFVPAVHGFLDTIRDGHPTTPLYLVSPVFCGIHETTPGPGSVDVATLGSDQVKFTATGQEGDTALGRLSLTVVRDALAEIVDRRRDDPQLHYVDGLALYGEVDAVEHPLPDALHPDTATHELIGNRFADEVLRRGAPAK
ncbi:lipase [Aeromicrobium camelliae]|uniref:Lipase n=1 Tax=Aeromicrobium camelliae TaxID=1538144 RepID=A0A3N6YHS2_9ACTN|nr:SGNH/GDSL hydrolase family protein [Aeromicrobium camelliae]RQN09344.1 lipase [Aeromicrobium camelliae]